MHTIVFSPRMFRSLHNITTIIQLGLQKISTGQFVYGKGRVGARRLSSRPKRSCLLFHPKSNGTILCFPTKLCFCFINMSQTALPSYQNQTQLSTRTELLPSEWVLGLCLGQVTSLQRQIRLLKSSDCRWFSVFCHNKLSTHVFTNKY